MKRERLFYLLMFAITMGGSALLGEMVCRVFLLNQMAPGTVLTSHDLPYFQAATDEIPLPGMTLSPNHRYTASKGVDRKIAMIGDSVTHCSYLPPGESFSELLQKMQDQADFYNFGVSGYGIPELVEVLREIGKSRAFKEVIYTFNVNDVIDAMPVLLSLKRRARDRFASYYDYVPGYRSQIKKVLVDWFRLPLYLHYQWGMLMTPPAATTERRVAGEGKPKEAGTASSCPYAFKINPHSESKTYPTLERVYGDPEVQRKLVEKLRQMKEIASSGGVTLKVSLFYDYYYLIHPESKVPFHIKSAFKEAGLDFMDFLEGFQEYGKTCHFYAADLGHFGPLGAKLYSKWILQEMGIPSLEKVSKSSEPGEGEHRSTAASPE